MSGERVRAFAAHEWGGRDVGDNSQFWKPATVLSVQGVGDDQIARLRFDDGHESGGHFTYALKPLLGEEPGGGSASAVRERDEAREALRELLITIAAMSQHPYTTAEGAAVVERAREVLEGVERTHALVPRQAMTTAGNFASREVVHSRDDGHTDQAKRAEQWANAYWAAGRGENLTWPETQA